MPRKTARNFTRILFVSALLTLVCAGVNGGPFLPNAPSAKSPASRGGVKKPARGSLLRGPQDGCTWDKTPPFFTTGTQGLEISTGGIIKGDILVVGIDCENKIVKLKPEEQAMIGSYFEQGLSEWMPQFANVCGSEVSFDTTPLKLHFNDSLDLKTYDKNILFVVTGANWLKFKSSKVLGKQTAENEASMVKSFEDLRGTGKLPPFTIVMSDPALVQASYPGIKRSPEGDETEVAIPGAELWKNTAAHEFGHAMGLAETFIVKPVPKKDEPNLKKPVRPKKDKPKIEFMVTTDEYPIGLMNAVNYTERKVHRAYIAEIMSRLYECRLDITTTLQKTIVPDFLGSNEWDFLGSMSSKYSGVLTSQWAYYNSLAWNTSNSCTTSNRQGKKNPKAVSVNTYLMCTAETDLNNADEIDFNLGPIKEDDFLWQKEKSIPTVPTQNFNVAKGDCSGSVNLTNTSVYTLEFIKPVFRLGSDGSTSWIQDVTINLQAKTHATDPNPMEGPTCESGITWDGTVARSGETRTTPITVTSSLTQNNREIGKYTIKVDLTLAPKSSGSRTGTQK